MELAKSSLDCLEVWKKNNYSYKYLKTVPKIYAYIILKYKNITTESEVFIKHNQKAVPNEVIHS